MTRTGLVLGASVVLFFASSSCTVRGTGTPDLPDVQLMDGGRSETSTSECLVDSQCADRFACTVDHCTAGSCTHAPCSDCCGAGLRCDAVLGCTTAADPCTTDAECMDDQPCTLDSCRDATSCEHQPTDSLCPSGQICIGSVGCVPEPPDHCETDEDCEAVGYCYGVWDCATELGCAYVGRRDCDDGDTCTTDRCDGGAAACAHDPRDADADTYADDACSGDDCDDGSSSVHPGATEACNGVDDDCDGMIDDGCCEAGPCTTPCGTTGMTSCGPDGTVGPCMPPIETCDGNDQDCDGLVDETFECERATTVPCDTSCGTIGTAICDSTCHLGTCVPPAEICDGADQDCDMVRDEGFACAIGDMSACGCGMRGSRTCLGSCMWDVCNEPTEICNGMDDNCSGVCDEGFGCCAGTSGPCTALGFRSGTATCTSGCAWDTSLCSNCGDGDIDSGEQCDTTDLGGQSCTTLGMGFGSGTLGCTSGCTFNTSACSRCRNGVRDAGESCDGTDFGTPPATCTTIPGGFSGGTLGCTTACAYNTSMCTSWNPSGTYASTPHPIFSCTYLGFTVVDFNIGSFTFIDDGTMLRVGGAPCGPTTYMAGASARNPGRTFDVTCTYAGTCAETYRLVGTFTGDNNWTGTFTAHYMGSCGTCDDPPNPETWSVSGVRP